MRTALTLAAFLSFGGAQAMAGALLVGNVDTAQYISVIAFLAGVAGVFAKIVQVLYQKIIDDKEKQIDELQARIEELTNDDEQP